MTPITFDTPLKFLTLGGYGPSSHVGWHLPTGVAPGEYMRTYGELVLCANGLHLTTLAHWRAWADARLYVAEHGPYACVLRPEGENKYIVDSARLTREVTAWTDGRFWLRSMVGLAQRALPHWHAAFPLDERPARALAAVRAYARHRDDGDGVSLARRELRESEDRCYSDRRYSPTNAPLRAAAYAIGAVAGCLHRLDESHPITYLTALNVANNAAVARMERCNDSYDYAADYEDEKQAERREKAWQDRFLLTMLNLWRG